MVEVRWKCVQPPLSNCLYAGRRFCASMANSTMQDKYKDWVTKVQSDDTVACCILCVKDISEAIILKYGVYNQANPPIASFKCLLKPKQIFVQYSTDS